MMEKTLPKLELYFYWGSSIFGILYSLYRVHLAGNNLSVLINRDLGDGWTFIGRKKDDSEEEWKLWSNFILSILSPWILIHYVVSKIICLTRRQMLPLWYCTITALCVIVNYGLNAFLVLILQPVIFSVVLIFSRSRILIWLVCYLLCYIFTHDQIVSLYSISHHDSRIIVPTIMWIYLRCISFCMDTTKEEITIAKLYAFFGYVFYLPCFFLGPILLFHKFFEQLRNRIKKTTFKTELELILRNFRYLFWLFFTELSLHFFYVNSMVSYVDLLSQIRYENIWIMYGIGFFMGQFFFLKYTVVYGLALTWTKAEGYETPDPPRCIAYICLYSDMWRYFDQALYFFIKRYIYEPCLELALPKFQLNKIAISFLCFVFVYVWHGLYYPIFMWSLANYCGIVVELICRRISEIHSYQHFVKTIGSRNERRLVAFLCSPLTVFSAISNFYFLGGSTVAETYFNYIFIRASITSLVYLWFFVYSLCNVSMEIKAMKKNS